LSVLAEIASIIAPLFVIAGIGLAWGRSGRHFDTNVVGALTLNLGVPCLIFSTLTKLQVSPAAFAEMSGAFALAVGLNMVLAASALRLMRLDVAGFLPTLVFANNGNMGLPLCLFAFGDAGLAFGICAFVISSIGNFTVGIGLVSGRLRLIDVFRNPYVYVIAAALVFMTTHAAPPRWLANTTEIVGGISIPLMLLALGVSLSRLKVQSIGRSLVLSLLRLVLGFLLGLGLAWAFGFEGAARGVLILQSAMPTAVMNYIIAARYDRNAGEVAGVIVASTAISFATLPLLLLVVL
jgi:predicted permease